MSHDESPGEKYRQLEVLLYEQLKAAEADWRAAGKLRQAKTEQLDDVPPPDGSLILLHSWREELRYREMYCKALKRFTNLVVHRIAPAAGA